MIHIECARIESMIEQPGLTNKFQHAVCPHECVFVLSLPNSPFAVCKQIDDQTPDSLGHRIMVLSVRFASKTSDPVLHNIGRPERLPIH